MRALRFHPSTTDYPDRPGWPRARRNGPCLTIRNGAARSKRNLVARVHLCNRRRHVDYIERSRERDPLTLGSTGVVERSLFSMLLAIVGVDHTLLRPDLFRSHGKMILK